MSIITQKQSKLISGGKDRVKQYVAATQTLTRGQLVYLSTGYITACADGAQIVYGIYDDQTLAAGVGEDGATYTTTDQLFVIPIDENSVIEMNVYHATAASAITAKTQVGVNYAIELDSGKNYCDVGDETTVGVTIKNLSPKDTVGDQYGRVEVAVIGSFIQKNIAS